MARLWHTVHPQPLWMCSYIVPWLSLCSGGKDSCFNMMECVRHGHEIVVLINIYPTREGEELDSFMYQTVGQEGIALYAEAMGLPLFQAPTSGRAVVQDLEYKAHESDEVEDLYKIVEKVKVRLQHHSSCFGRQLANISCVAVLLRETSILKAFQWVP